MSKKLILVLGATGAQGLRVTKALLASQDGTPSPYSVRAFVRDPTNERAQLLASMGAELFKGDVTDLHIVDVACEGCYGMFVNTDTFAIGHKNEIFGTIKMFEQAHRIPEMRHFIWSSLDHASKYDNYHPKYRAAWHFDGKGNVTDFLRSQPSSPSGDSLTWSVITTGPYFENLAGPMLGPLPERENGAVVWALPIGDGRLPAISLDDIGWWTRYTFDHRSETSGKELQIASELMTMKEIVETFTRVTGIPAVYRDSDEWLHTNPEYSDRRAKESPTAEEVYGAMYHVWRNHFWTRDMEWIKRIHPNGQRLEDWIKATGYDGSRFSYYDKFQV